MKHVLTVTPAIPPKIRHKIEEVLEKEGYEVMGGGTMADASECDISFEKKDE